MGTSTKFGAAIVACLHLACGAPAPEGNAIPSGPESAGNSVSEVAEHQDTVRVLFEELFGDAGRLTVVKDSDARISFAVQADIGSDAERLMREAHAASSLADVYRALHARNVEVPKNLAAISDELEASKLATSGVPRREQLTAEEQEDGSLADGTSSEIESHDKSQAAFMSAYCHDITAGGILYKPGNHCFWEVRNTLCASFIFTTRCANPPGCTQMCQKVCTQEKTGCAPMGPMFASGIWIDRAYGWNATPSTATMAIFGGHDPAVNNNWRPTVGAWGVIWVQWGGTYDFGNTSISLPVGVTGELGLTAHEAMPTVVH